MSEEKETLISGLTAKSLTVGIILVMFWALYYVIITGFSRQVMAQLPAIMVSFFILTIISRFLPNFGFNHGHFPMVDRT